MEPGQGVICSWGTSALIINSKDFYLHEEFPYIIGRFSFERMGSGSSSDAYDYRDTSPISSAQVSAVMGPTPGTVLRRWILSARSGSRLREFTRAYSVFWHRTIVSRLSRSNGRIFSWISGLLASSSRK